MDFIRKTHFSIAWPTDQPQIGAVIAPTVAKLDTLITQKSFLQCFHLNMDKLNPVVEALPSARNTLKIVFQAPATYNKNTVRPHLEIYNKQAEEAGLPVLSDADVSAWVDEELGWFNATLNPNILYLNLNVGIPPCNKRDRCAILAFATAAHELAHFFYATLETESLEQLIPFRPPTIEAGHVFEVTCFGGRMCIETAIDNANDVEALLVEVASEMQDESKFFILTEGIILSLLVPNNRPFTEDIGGIDRFPCIPDLFLNGAISIPGNAVHKRSSNCRDRKDDAGVPMPLPMTMKISSPPLYRRGNDKKTFPTFPQGQE
ncbi:hypothetical protein BDK51DRAFT_34839 [Blyttiomyces helicus]|uniref:Uncharacterized protein n=1 Tax=Blyttiomyces helicus TaxID=388810 RepID=A0A4P9WQR6_9FUNG|nr:hypothetical protein BDK51DRAFT_34839 [Blyttiomyces helicus]|eukprot:RKO94168.1 hypothetical protein BDK51DRAFT_34839 [Blyttiomyces helicus]